MRSITYLLLAGALACLAAGERFATGGQSAVSTRGNTEAGYYFWSSNETGEWAPEYEWFDPSYATGWRGDDVCWPFVVPFDIRLCGVDYPVGTTLYIGSNGVVGFSAEGLTDPLNQYIPNSLLPNALIAPLWDNLDGGEDGMIYLDLEDNAPERKLYITFSPWYYHSSYIDPIEFQLVIYESGLEGVNNTLEFRYKDVEGDSWRDYGASATVGLENAWGTAAALFSLNRPALENLFAIRFVDQCYVDDQLGEFHLLLPEDSADVSPAVIVHFMWEPSRYDGHGQRLYALYLADDPQFENPRVLFTADNELGVVFDAKDAGRHWWKVLAYETDLGFTRWSEEVFTFDLAPSAVVEKSWGAIKAEF